ncbi:MAG: DUF4405 domain-containing protein [Anaerolineales bacterium]
MDRRTINYWIDIGLLISFLLVFITGLAKFPGLGRYFGFMYEIIAGRTLARIHDWSGLFMGAFALAHLILHFRWLVAMTGRLFKGGE